MATTDPTGLHPTLDSSGLGVTDLGPTGLLHRMSLVVAAILTGLFAGFFITYQISVTRGLAEVDDLTYVQTFQWINATVQTPEFAVIFFGTVPSLVVALVLHRRADRLTVGLVAFALLMALATVAITAVGNVPLNRELAEFETLTPEIAQSARADFEDPWNRLNLIRTLTAFAGAVSIGVAVGVRRVR